MPRKLANQSLEELFHGLKVLKAKVAAAQDKECACEAEIRRRLDRLMREAIKAIERCPMFPFRCPASYYRLSEDGVVIVLDSLTHKSDGRPVEAERFLPGEKPSGHDDALAAARLVLSLPHRWKLVIHYNGRYFESEE